MMPQSMTGFATLGGSFAAWRWVWDIRSVNGRGLDVRMRLPDWIEGIEPKVRAALKDRVARGSVTVGLRVTREDSAAPAQLDPQALAVALDRIADVTAAAEARGVALRPASAPEILAMRGMLDSPPPEDDPAPLAARLANDLGPLLDAFVAARATEGAALATLLTAQIDRIAELEAEARALAGARAAHMADALRSSLARVQDAVQTVDEARVAQELALIAVKADVTEELDRLQAHIAQARTLLAAKGPVGRKFDFLTQEFNREANTLCSKSSFTELTRIGLDLKTVIDQMREQVQNVE